MNLQPLNGNVLLRLSEAPTRSARGLFLPDASTQRPSEGVVVALASDVGKDLDLGDRVLFRKNAGEELELDGEKLRLIAFSDLLARVPQADVIPS